MLHAPAQAIHQTSLSPARHWHAATPPLPTLNTALRGFSVLWAVSTFTGVQYTVDIAGYRMVDWWWGWAALPQGLHPPAPPNSTVLIIICCILLWESSSFWYIYIYLYKKDYILDIIYSHRIYLFNVSGCSGPRRGGVTRTVTDHRMWSRDPSKHHLGAMVEAWRHGGVAGGG